MLRSPRSAAEAHSRPGAAVTAEGLGVRGPRGWAFRDISVAAEPGALIAVAGPSGSGRTCLLLALTGRMRIAAGHAEVAGYRLPRQMTAVRRCTGLGPVPGVSDLEPALTVAEHLRERALLARRFDGPLRGLLPSPGKRAAQVRARVAEALARAGLDLDELPKGPRTAVRDLERLEALRLSVALALIGAPRLLAVDDTDLKLSAADQDRAWSMLRGVTAGGTTVLAVCSEPPAGAVLVTTGSAPPAAPTAPKAPADSDRPDGSAPPRGPAAPNPTDEAESSAPPAPATLQDTTHTVDGADGGAAAVQGTATALGGEPTSTSGPGGAAAADGPGTAAGTYEEGASDAIAEAGRA